jgi:hypothetical protein
MWRTGPIPTDREVSVIFRVVTKLTCRRFLAMCGASFVYREHCTSWCNCWNDGNSLLAVYKLQVRLQYEQIFDSAFGSVFENDGEPAPRDVHTKY